MYSLISAPVLGFDLARMDGGAQAAQVLACALLLDEPGLLTLGTCALHREGGHNRRQQERLALTEPEAEGSISDTEVQRMQAWMDVNLATTQRADECSGLAGLSKTMISALEQHVRWLDPTNPATETSAADAATQAPARVANPTVGGELGEPQAPPTAEKLVASLENRRAESNALAAVLEQAPLGSLEALLRCLREEILDWVAPLLPERSGLERSILEAGVAMICDAAAAAYTRQVLPSSAWETLWLPWQQAYAQLDQRYKGPNQVVSVPFAVPGTKPLGMQLNPQVMALLAKLALLQPEQLDQICQAGNRWRFRDPSWSAAVHDASWAITLSQRSREAALAQLCLVQLCAELDWPIANLAAGDWNTLSGAVHALVVKDLLDTETLQRLTGACAEVFGWLGPDEEAPGRNQAA